MKERNQRQSLGGNIVLFALGSIGSKLINFIMVPLYTSVLSTDEYGVSDLIVTLYSLVIPVTTILIYNALMRFSLEDNADHRQIFSSALLINLLGLTIFIFLSPIALLYKPLKPYYSLFLAYCIMHSLYELLLYFAKGIDRVRDFTAASLLVTIFNVSFNLILLLYFRMGVRGYLLANVLAFASAIVYLIIRLKVWRYVLSVKNVSKSLIKQMIAFAAPIVPNSASWWISNNSDKFIIIFFHGVALSGIYAISYKIPSVLQMISSIFCSAWQISSVEDFGSEKSKSFCASVFRKFVSMQVLLTSGVILFCELAAKMLFKNDFFEAWKYIPILSLAVMFHSFGSFLASIYTAAKKTKGLAISTIGGAIINIILNFLLIGKFGAYGAALATLISYIIVYVIRVLHSQKLIVFKIRYKSDIFSFTVLFAQVIICMITGECNYLINGMFFCILVICRWDFIVWGVDYVKEIIGKIIFKGAGYHGK